MQLTQEDLSAVADLLGDQIPKALARKIAIRALARMLRLSLGEQYQEEVRATLQQAADLAQSMDPDVGAEMHKELRALLLVQFDG